MAYDENEIDKIKHALGDMCIAWAHLEDGCYTILNQIVDGELSAMEFLRNELDFGRALQVCKAHAIGNNWEAHCEHIPVLVEMIDQTIRPRRNRYVHDPIYSGLGSLERRTPKTRYVNVPFKGVQVLLADYTPIRSTEIYALNNAIRYLESYAGAIIRYQDWLKDDVRSAWDSPKLGVAQLGAYFAISEYTQLTKSLGSAG